MKKFGSRQVIPLIMAVIGVVFAGIGFIELGFWDSAEGPKPGFFPSIIAVVMAVTSVLAFIQSFKDDGHAEYKKEELLIIGAALGCFAAVFIIGLVPTCIVFVILWLKLFEKESWKNIMIVVGVVAIIVIGVFGFWLGIQFPMGLLEYIM